MKVKFYKYNWKLFLNSTIKLLKITIILYPYKEMYFIVYIYKYVLMRNI